MVRKKPVKQLISMMPLNKYTEKVRRMHIYKFKYGTTSDPKTWARWAALEEHRDTVCVFLRDQDYFNKIIERLIANDRRDEQFIIHALDDNGLRIAQELLENCDQAYLINIMIEECTVEHADAC